MNCNSQTLALSGTIGTQEMLIIFAIILLLFGGKKIPQLAKGIARSLVEFRKGRNEYSHESQDTIKPHDQP